MLIFVLQAIWTFISDFAGKDIELIIIGKFLFYYLPYQVPLLLPLTILVSSIMTFGDFAENYEFAAMKSAGISLQRAMKSLIFFIVALGFATFYFSNTVIPWAEFKAINLKNNIAKVKPAMAIVAGVFTEIGENNIKVAKKSGENDQFLEDVIIHQKKKNRQGNYTVIKSKSGELSSDENSNLLQLTLYEGNFYDEVYPKTIEQRKNLPFIKSSFKEHIINIDLSNMNDVDLGDESARHPYRMLNTNELVSQIDSASININTSQSRYQNMIKQRNGFYSILNYKSSKKSTKNQQNKTLTAPTTKTNTNTNDNLIKAINKGENTSLQMETNTLEISKVKTLNDTVFSKVKKLNLNDKSPKNLSSQFEMDSILIEFAEREWSQILSRAITTVNSISPQVKNQENLFKNRYIIINKTEIHLHNKYALGVACVILFFVGAPLGAIIRKGGIGLPLVFAILIFLIYHFLGIFAQNSAETGKISPFIGSWISTFVFLPIGIYFTYRATTDRGFINIDFIAVPIRKLMTKLKLDKYKTRS